ncbi:L,D-transpeptidase [Rhodovulum sp. BSW8]|uniref:Lipoprotein-anchoring transpeptidase ErfK/SrfK n=1 Tax=Rhodovulum kholense TaxID=453584 RepID=A0A8E2VLY4_9RHOB|nr:MULTISPECIES: L,D-transpeptidase [Rhodovulum]PTW50795.1 lipoprotein-anchoring transpeptidase ErfK/SrfK [Rhodovulum kholense]RBO54988.1 L,D-transpeptidase [Rhodovulum sp. BSW8]
MTDRTFSRRAALVTLGAGLGAPALLRAEPAPMARRNISSFARQDWRDHFDRLGKAVIVADTSSRALHFWSGDGTDYRIYPTSVPISEDLTKRGYTEVVRKKVGPDWTPTPSMVERNPDLRYMPPGPGNPLGTHAMYLSWPAYLIHGTHDTRKIGRPSSDGCIGLYNDMIAELYDITPIGTRVRII